MNGDVFTTWKEPDQHALEFRDPQMQPFLTLHPDGRITIGEHLSADEATQQFLNALRVHYPRWLEEQRGATLEQIRGIVREECERAVRGPCYGVYMGPG